MTKRIGFAHFVAPYMHPSLTLAKPPAGVAAALELFRHEYQGKLTLRNLAVAAKMPQNTLTRQFNRYYGASPMRSMWTLRLLLAAEYLVLAPTVPLAKVAKHCGFASAAHFSRRFRELYAESPRQYRSRNGLRLDSQARFTSESLGECHELALTTALAKMLRTLTPPHRLRGGTSINER